LTLQQNRYKTTYPEKQDKKETGKEKRPDFCPLTEKCFSLSALPNFKMYQTSTIVGLMYTALLELLHFIVLNR
jgi:hypothetical protein